MYCHPVIVTRVIKTTRITVVGLLYQQRTPKNHKLYGLLNDVSLH